MLQVTSHSPEETDALGRAIGERLQPGAFVALIGDLGAGKTRLSRAILAGLGVSRTGGSPTFTLLWEYEGRLPVYHFDVYRLKSPDELEDIGYEEYFYGRGVCLVEWADRVEERWPDRYLRADIAYRTGPDDGRILTLTARGEAEERLLKELADAGFGV